MKTTYKVVIAVVLLLLAVLGYRHVKRGNAKSLPVATRTAPAPARNRPAAMPT